MPHPKRRMSKTRTAKRRTHYKAISATTTLCPQCSTAKLSHTICPSCGYYNGRQIVNVD